MPRSSRFAALPVLAALLHLASPLPAQLSPEAALASLKPAAGLQVSLFASEPEVVNPTCLDIDPAGRVWVCEGVNYRARAKPPHRKTGDRIVVLWDQDGDGRAERSSVFLEGLELETPLGICWLPGRVLVSQSPRIFSIEIRPDGTAGAKRDFLVGFDGVNHDHGVHSLVLGPDGLLYGAFGNSGARLTDRSGRRLATDGNPLFGGVAFRVGLDAADLEPLAHNFRNNYECALDSFGDIFQSDNDDDGNRWVRFVHVLPGGNYGYLGPTGRHWAEEGKSHWHLEDPGVAPILLRTGAGSPTGLCVYEGDLLPERYRGMPIHADAGPGVVQGFRLRPQGAGFRVEEAPLDASGRQTAETLSRIVEPERLLSSSDSWFRPSDVAVAPDGSLLVSDWYDPGVGGHGMGDTTRGRIYRLTPPGPRDYRPPALDLETDRGLREALASPCLSTWSAAQLRLRERGEAARAVLEEVLRSGAGFSLARGAAHVRARALWLLGALPSGRRSLEAALSDPEPRFRILALRALERHAGEAFLQLARPLIRDPDPAVRRELLLQLRAVPGEEALQAVVELADSHDGHDPIYLAAVGIACRGREGPAFRALAARWGGRFGEREAGILREIHPPEAVPFLVERVRGPGAPRALRSAALRALAEVRDAQAGLAVIEVAAAGEPEDLRGEAARLLEGRLRGPWQSLRGREELRRAAEALLDVPGLALQGTRLAAAGRVRSLWGRIEEVLLSSSAPEELRLAAVEAVGRLDEERAAGALGRAAASAPPRVAEAAVASLGRLKVPAAEEALREVLLRADSPALRTAAVKGLGESKSGALLLLRLAEDGEMPEAARALSTTVVHSSGWEDVRLLARKVLPQPRTGEGKALPPPAELLSRPGEARRGEEAFQNESKGNCSRCHRIGKKGSDVGPDLSAIGLKLGKEALLEAMLSPSASISHEYRVWILQTRSAGFIMGYLVEEGEEGIVLRDANGKRHSFKKSDVLERKPSDASLMPEGLVGSMTAGDLVDIVEFLGRQRAGAEAGAR